MVSLIAASSRVLVTPSSLLAQMAIDSRDNQGRDRAISEKIVERMQSIGRAPRKPFTGEELQKLQSAASRLDQMLKAAEDADQQALKTAAERLDRLLRDMRAGKDVSRIFRRRENVGR